MAGGTWLSQNKKRPGAYINFKSVPRPSMTVGDRGIVAIPMSLSWGNEGELIEVLSTELLDGSSRKKVGFDAFSPESKLLAGALSYCYKALVYRMNSGGAKATATIGSDDDEMTITAKHTGTYGNKIMVAVVANGSLFDVITYVDGSVVNSQTVATIPELDDNDYVSFAGTGTPTANAGTTLTRGTDGTSTETTAYPLFLNALKMAHFQTVAIPTSETAIKSSIVTFIQNLRENEGRYIQAVVADYDGADYEGIINSVNGCAIDGVEYSKEEFTAIVAGMTAGANFNQSNTARKITGATKIIGELNDAEIKEGLGKGKFILSTSANGDIKVEQDINSHHTYTKDKDYNFSKNRVMRTLDEIGTTTRITWENTYMGKVDNNRTGRGLFKSDLVAYGNELQRLSGIQEFNGSDDITIEQGNDLDSVIVEWYVKPVDSMEKLYMNVMVKG